MMKKWHVWIATLLIIVLLTACGKDSEPSGESSADSGENNTEISLWVYPVGNLGNPKNMASLLSVFHKEYPNITVTVEYLDYDNGDATVEQAIEDGTAPDLVLEGPERLVANWGDRGLMADLSDLWDSPEAGKVYENIRKACQYRDGAYYEFPVCMTTHCMAINYDMFREAGALAYIDEENRTWTTEGFIQAVQALTAYGKKAGEIYCENQSGDQGTRALVNNLYGGQFTDDEHTGYTIDSSENIEALRLLYGLEGITFEPSMTSADAIGRFCNKETAMSFCWNVSMEIQKTIENPDMGFDVFPMAFPTDDGKPRLQGGIWGFGIFDNGQEEKIEAAKTFIRFMTGKDSQYARIVRTSGYWPVRDMDNIYENDQLMEEYGIFAEYMGDYYQITPGWPSARTAWWNMLQKIGAGTDAAQAVKDFQAGMEE